jgi:hypothetical protein
VSVDLRWRFAPLPQAAPGFDPAGDASALVVRGMPSPAAQPIPGRQYLASLGAGQRYLVRVPDAWNGKLAVAGTPGFRSEFANDAIWSDYLLARGYAFASSNKGIPTNVVWPGANAETDADTYLTPFDVPGLPRGTAAYFGVLTPERIGVETWSADLAATIEAAHGLLNEIERAPERTYAVGLSNGGAQVRSLLEARPELVDGGVEWASVYWTGERNLLTLLPRFLALMPAYVASGFRDRALHDEIVAAGFPPDRTQPDAAHPSLWFDHYANVPFYSDVTLFAFARLLDERARVADLAERAAYVPPNGVRTRVESFAHTGALRKPLVGIAGEADVFITPEHHAIGYRDAVVRAGAAEHYRLFLVDDGTHVDGFVPFGYGLRPQVPFAWAAFEALERAVETDAALPGEPGAVTRVREPAQVGAGY